MHRVCRDLLRFKEANDFKQFVDLYECLLCVKRGPLVRSSQYRGARKGICISVVLCFGFGSVVHFLFGSWHHPFYFSCILFYFSPCLQPRICYTCSTPPQPHVSSPGALDGFLTTGGHILRTWVLFENRFMGINDY